MRISTIMLALLAAVGTYVACAGDPVDISSGKMSLKFASDGKPKSFKAGDRELLNEQEPGPGLELKGFAFNKVSPTSFLFKELKFDGKQLVASIGDKIRVTFDVKATDRYITFKINRVEGVPKSNLLWLQFKMNMLGDVKTLPLDYITSAGGKGCEVKWPWLWGRSAKTPLGGFAIYVPLNDQDEDETLLQIWANEGLPHPKVKGEWNVETARKWLAEWQKEFADQSQMLITANSNEELYKLADFAAKLDIRRIYMHTDTWRGEYWPVKFSFLHLNPKTFPNGEEDFQKFAKYAKSKGLGLTIHTVSCAIANQDPDYIIGKIDPRLAKWITGELAQPVSESDSTIRFKPAPGEELPMNIDRPVTGPANVDPWNNIKTMRIGNEFVIVGQFSDTDKDVWVLKDCKRGQFKTSASPHAAGTETVGIIRPYDQCFTADNDSTLVDELGRRIAEFYNRNNVIHCEQDAGEIHTVNHQWGYSKFAEAVYTNLDHPVTSNNSGGTPMPCQFEYRFNSSKTAVAARNQASVTLMPARNGRPSTGPYEMSSNIGKAIAAGAMSVGIQKPEPMFGVSTDILEKHGLSSLAADTVLNWKKIAPLLGEQQRKAILATGDEVIYRAEKKGDGYEITPLRMLYRPGIDVGWKSGSEFGIVVPRQYFMTGESLAVENPYAGQEPEFVIRVMNGFNAKADEKAIEGGKAVEVASKEKEIIEAYNIGAGLKKGEHPLQDSWHIWAKDAVTSGEANSGKCWLRKTFKWSKADAGRVSLVYHVDNEATIWVNSKKIASGGAWNMAYGMEITSFLKEGDNVIAVEPDNTGGPGCFTAAIIFNRADKSTIIPSDKTWKSSAVQENKWQEPDFDDSKWKDSLELCRFGESVWPRAEVSLVGKQKFGIQPKAANIRNVGDHKFSDEGDALRIQFENKRNEVITNESKLPSWNCSANMSEARGIGLTVTGDGSNAVLVIQAHCSGPRDYIVPIDFKGTREIVIPCGEVSWADARWGWRFETKGAQYGSLTSASIGLGKVPPKTNVDIKVGNIRILPEIPTALKNPVISMGSGSMEINGSIPSESYVWYKGGDTIGVYDLNWKKFADLPVVKKNFTAPKGKLEIRVESKDSSPAPWLECQFFVKDTPMIVNADAAKR